MFLPFLLALLLLPLALPTTPPFVGIDTLLDPTFLDPDDRSHGMVFDIQTLPDAAVVQITDLEVYIFVSEEESTSTSSSMVEYQVYAKEGSWQDASSVRDYSLMSEGNVTWNGSNASSSSSIRSIEENGYYIPQRIPLTTALRLNGNGTRYAISIGLSERIGLFQYPQSSSSYVEGQDYLPLVETNELLVYIGAAIMIYPFQKANHPVYFRKPRGFVGRLWYEWDACLPSGVVLWTECTSLATNLTQDEREGIIGEYGGGPSQSQVVPTLSPVPTTTEVDDITQLYLLLVFDELPSSLGGTVLTKADESILEQVLLEFYQHQEVLAINEVDVQSVQIWLQQFVVVDHSEGRWLQSSTTIQQETPTTSTTTMVQYQVTVRLTIAHSALPPSITRELLVNAINENQSSFFTTLKLTPELTPYFQNIGRMASIVSLDQVTMVPTPSPTEAPTRSTASGVVLRDSTPPTAVVAILVLTIYTCSVLFSTCYLKRSRSQMERDRDMQQLLRSTTIEPDIKGSRADFGIGPEKEEEQKKKKRTFGRFKSKMATMTSMRHLKEEEDGKSDLDPSVEETKKTRYDEEKENTSSVEISDESYSSEKESSSSSSDDDSDHLSIA